MRYFVIISVFLSFLGCTNKQKKITLKDTVTTRPIHVTTHSTDTLQEEFIDSLTIGVKGHYKVELRKFTNADSVYVKIKLSEKKAEGWLKKQEFIFKKDEVTSADPAVSDFNNDGLGDLTFQSDVAARGANEVRKLFIFDKASGKLVFIKNSENYPNMLYNKKLNCIDALLVSGSWATVFLHLEKDTLREFANVDVRGDILNLTVTDRNGKRRHLIKDKKVDVGMFPRFKNYDPLEEYDEK